jgi:hypothetical protein
MVHYWRVPKEGYFAFSSVMRSGGVVGPEIHGKGLFSALGEPSKGPPSKLHTWYN